MFSLMKKNLVAVSGGVDSMVLLNQYKNKNIAVVHINHNTRGEENIQEENLVKDFCEKNEIKFYKFDYFHKEGNFHKKAREFRYNKFAQIVKEEDMECVLLAHHLDDQIENIKMNPKKIGSKIMKEKEYINDILVCRPMLDFTKDQIYSYAKENGVDYIEDSSNSKDKYLRNRVRKEVKLYSIEKKQEILNEEKTRIKELEKIKSLFLEKKVYDSDLNTKEKVYVFLKINNISSNISINKINDIQRFLSLKKNGSIQIEKNIILENSYHVVSIKSNQEKKSEEKKELKKGENKFNCFIFENDINGYVRSYKKGDKIKLKKGSKKVSRFFIDEKIEKENRIIWPIIVNEKDSVIRVLRKEEVRRYNGK